MGHLVVPLTVTLQMTTESIYPAHIPLLSMTPSHLPACRQWCAGTHSQRLLRTDCTHIFPTLCLALSHTLKWATVGVLTSWHSTNAPSQGFIKSQLINTYQHITVQPDALPSVSHKHLNSICPKLEFYFSIHLFKNVFLLFKNISCSFFQVLVKEKHFVPLISLHSVGVDRRVNGQFQWHGRGPVSTRDSMGTEQGRL